MSYSNSTYIFIFQEIIPTAPGMLIHIINLLVLILLPMVIIHIKDGFSLGKLYFTIIYRKEIQGVSEISVSGSIKDVDSRHFLADEYVYF